jgi:signal transduction histidine kinase
MSLPDWFRPPCQLLTIVLALAVVSSVAIAGLGWVLLRQDRDLEAKRQQDRIEQAVDRASAVAQNALADLQAHLSDASPTTPLPAGTSLVTIDATGVTARPETGLLYQPITVAVREVDSQALVHAERLELTGDIERAAAAYAQLTRSNDKHLRAEGLTGVGRVARKRRRPAEAIHAYDQLETLIEVDVAGLPPGLIARVGRAAVFEDTHDRTALIREAEALASDLSAGRWRISRSTYAFYRTQAIQWIGHEMSEDPDAANQAAAVDWLWTNRPVSDAPVRRIQTFGQTATLIISRSDGPRIRAVLARTSYLTSIGARSVASDLRWGMTDIDGRVVAGDVAPGKGTVVRMAATAGLPWNFYVFTPANRIPSSPLAPLLRVVLAAVVIVLAVGWYFAFRAVRRELTLAQLQADFVAAVSHEFRSPLTSLSHIADLLAGDRLPSDTARRQSYDMLVRDTDRLRRLVEDLLDLGRFDSGAAAFRFDTIDLPELVRTTVSDFQARPVADGFAIELHCSLGQLFVRADREALTRALWNLLDNAVKYSADARTAWVDVDRSANQVTIAVRDQGIGIPPSEQHAIFNRFVRGAESKLRRIRGTGIGLAMVQQIIHAHGGQVAVESALGRGSTFRLTVPVAANVGQPLPTQSSVALRS